MCKHRLGVIKNDISNFCIGLNITSKFHKAVKNRIE